MISQRSIYWLAARAGFLNQTSRILGPRFESRPFDVKQDYSVFPGLENAKCQAPMLANAAPRFLGTLGFLKVNDKVSISRALTFRSDIHSACPKEFETVRDTRSLDFERGTIQENERDVRGSQLTRSMDFRSGIRQENGRDMGGSQFTRSMEIGRGITQENGRDMGGSQFTRSMDFGRGITQENGRDIEGSQFTRSMDFGRGITQENGRDIGGSQRTRSIDFVRGIIHEDGRDMGGSQLSRYNVEKDAHIVHIKILRNNTFVTVTDSKGNKKIGASAGCLPTKNSRYAAEATAEHVGRLAKNMGLKSFVVKVNGFNFFKKKKLSILAFKDGYTNSRSDQNNPIVQIEDNTRLAHNGCRLRKQRRV